MDSNNLLTNSFPEWNHLMENFNEGQPYTGVDGFKEHSFKCFD
jgi:hypothetical protein